MANLLKAFLVFIFALPCAYADIKWVRFSFQFGGSSLQVNGRDTYGNGWSATTELYTSEKSGYLVNVGASHTEAESINFFGTKVASLEIDNRYLQPGAFWFPLKGLRLAAGPSFNWIDQELEVLGDKSEENRSFAGPFVNLSYRLPLESVILGAQYNYASFGDYAQSDLFFLLGFAF